MPDRHPCKQTRHWTLTPDTPGSSPWVSLRSKFNSLPSSDCHIENIRTPLSESGPEASCMARTLLYIRVRYCFLPSNRWLQAMRLEVEKPLNHESRDVRSGTSLLRISPAERTVHRALSVGVWMSVGTVNRVLYYQGFPECKGSDSLASSFRQMRHRSSPLKFPR